MMNIVGGRLKAIYAVWCRDRRIKPEYGMSIMGKRIELGLVA